MKIRLIHYGVALLALQGLAACSDAPAQNNVAAPAAAAAAPAAEPIGDGPLILLFGDSLFAGYGLPAGEGLAPELQRVLRAGGLAANVANGGVSGDTSAAGRARLAFTLDGLPRQPDLVIVGLGGNDMLRGLPPTETRANLDAMLTLLDERGIPAMLSGMRAPPNLGADYQAAFDPIYPDLAQAHGAALYPFLLAGVHDQPGLLLPDGIHPNADGVDRIARALAPSVTAALGD